MAKLDIRLTPEQHEALDASLKQFYVPTEDGKGFELEGIGSIQRAFEAEKAKKVTKPELITELEQLRQEKAERDAKADKEAQDLLVKQGEFEKAQQARDTEWQKRLEAATADSEKLMTNLRRESLKTLATEKYGILPDRVRAAIAEGDLENVLEFEYGETGPNFKKKGGIGDEAELKSFFAELRDSKPYLFAANSASGSGASGSQQSAGNGAKSVTRAQWDAASTSERVAWGADVKVTE